MILSVKYDIYIGLRDTGEQIHGPRSRWSSDSWEIQNFRRLKNHNQPMQEACINVDNLMNIQQTEMAPTSFKNAFLLKLY